MSKEIPEEYRVKGILPGGMDIFLIWAIAIVVGVTVMTMAGGMA